MRPLLGTNSPARKLSNVDLPAPFEPITVTNSPAAMAMIDILQRAIFERRAPVEDDAKILDADHLRPPALSAKADLRTGSHSAIATSTAVTTLTSDAVRPIAPVLSASASAMR